MKSLYIEHLGDHAGEEASVSGWLYHKRSSGKIRFLVVRDGTGIVQCVMARGSVPEEVFASFDALTQESSIEVSGRVRKDDRAPGGVEMEVTGLRIVSLAKDYPITPKEHGVDFLMDHRHLWLRSSRQHAIQGQAPDHPGGAGILRRPGLKRVTVLHGDPFCLCPGGVGYSANRKTCY